MQWCIAAIPDISYSYQSLFLYNKVQVWTALVFNTVVFIPKSCVKLTLERSTDSSI